MGTLGVYGEACCPDTQDYIISSSAPAWRTEGFQDIVDILYVPWGKETYNKSAETGEYSYQCQHGPNECIDQSIQACAAMLVKPSEFIDFVIDLETEMFKAKCQNSTHCCDATSMAQSVAERLQMNWNEIENCVDSQQMVDQAEMMAYTSTAMLKPALTWVPWITLQGNHTDKIQSDCVSSTLKCVCA